METFESLISADKPVLVDFFATWCGPCKMMAPILKDVKDRMGDSIKVIKIDVDKNQRLAAQFNVQGVPTLMVFKNGQTKWRQSGVVQARQLEQILQQHIA